MNLIGLTGLARAGKDSVADLLQAKHGFVKYAFAKPLKDGVKVMFGLTDDHVYGHLKEVIHPLYGVSPRQMMQWAGTEFGRSLVNPNCWIIRAGQAYDILEHDAYGMVISDVRFENEADFIRQRGGMIVHISRKAADAIKMDHASEGGVVPMTGDWFIDNNGSIDELEFKVDALLNAADDAGLLT